MNVNTGSYTGTVDSNGCAYNICCTKHDYIIVMFGIAESLSSPMAWFPVL